VIATIEASRDFYFVTEFFPTSLALFCTYESLLDARR
jgi:hypothetical protein